MCTANASKELIKSLSKNPHALDAVASIAPLGTAATVAAQGDWSDRKFKNQSYEYQKAVQKEASNVLAADIPHFAQQPTEAERKKLLATYAEFPDVKQKAFDTAFPNGVTPENKRLHAAVFEGSEPLWQGGPDDYHQLAKGSQWAKRMNNASARKANRESLDGSPIAVAELPEGMRKLDAEEWEITAWRHALANYAARAMTKEGIKYNPKGSEEDVKTLEQYMGRREVQAAAYREAYGGSTQGAPRAIAALFEGKTSATATANVFPNVSAANTPAAGQSLTPGTPEFEAEKQRRMAAWKDKAAQQLRIESNQNNERK